MQAQAQLLLLLLLLVVLVMFLLLLLLLLLEEEENERTVRGNERTVIIIRAFSSLREHFTAVECVVDKIFLGATPSLEKEKVNIRSVLRKRIMGDMFSCVLKNK